jgi:7-cyano-7-deazaguanine synthase
MKKRSKTVLILSGGMESAVISALAHQKADSDLHAVFVDYGQKTRDHEATAVQRLSRRYGMQMETFHLSLPYLEDHLLVDRNSVIYTKKSAEEYGFPWRETVEGNGMGHLVPLRNLIFLSLAASYADVLGATEIWTGFDYKQFREDMTSAERCEAAPDKSEGFVSLAEETIRTISKLEPTIVTPVQGYTKKKTKELGDHLGVDWMNTWSCYNAFSLHCGVCGPCEARKSAGVPTLFINPSDIQVA